jgi:folate-dependent tRNA-U54 methylase TrmFO/GidA
MRILQFVADGQRLKKQTDCDFSGLVAGSEGYLRAKFTFSDEWLGCKKAASFWVGSQEYARLLDDDNSCVIPTEALVGALFEVSVVGVKPNYKIGSTRTKVRQEVC